MFIPDTPDGTVGRQFTLRIEADATAIGMRTVEDLSNAAAIAALVAAPFTGGASLALMVPIGMVGAVPAAYRLADNYSADTLRFDTLTTWLDVVDVLSAFAGPLGRVTLRATKSTSTALRVVGYTGRGVAIIGAGADKLGLILVNAHTIVEIRKIMSGPGTDSQKRAAVTMLLAGALQANGMAVAPHLMNHGRAVGLPDAGAGHRRPTTGSAVDAPARHGAAVESGSPRARGGVDEPTTRRVGAGPEDVGPARADVAGDDSVLVRRDRAGDAGGAGEHGQPVVRLVADPSLAAGLAPDVARGLGFSRELGGDSRSLKVHFDTDIFGLVRNIELVAGERVTAADVAAHASTISRLQRYQGFQGLVRIALNKVQRTLGMRGDPPTDSLAFEALLELHKLPEVIQLRMQELAGAIERGSPHARDIEADIANLRRQMDAYVEMFETGYQQPGRGYVAALDAPAFARMRRQVTRRIRHPADTDLGNRRAWNRRFSERLDRAVETLERSGLLTDRDRRLIVDELRAPTQDDGMVSRSALDARVRRLERLATQLAGQGEPRRTSRINDLETHLREVLDGYVTGTTTETRPRPIERTRGTDDRLRPDVEAARQAIDRLADHATMSPIEFGLAYERARGAVGRVRERMRALGEPLFRGTEQAGPSRRPTMRPLNRHSDVTESRVVARAEGEVTEGLDRTLPEVGLERYLDSSGDLPQLGFRRTLRQRLAAMFRGYQRAHMVGPGFGSELLTGLWLAPDRFNLRSQNRGIEAIIRKASDLGWHVEVAIEAVGKRLRLPLEDGTFTEITILESIGYEVRYSTTGGEPGSARRIRFEIGDPANRRRITTTENDFIRLGELGLSDADIAQLRGQAGVPDPVPTAPPTGTSAPPVDLTRQSNPVRPPPGSTDIWDRGARESEHFDGDPVLDPDAEHATGDEATRRRERTHGWWRDASDDDLFDPVDDVDIDRTAGPARNRDRDR